VIGTITYHFVSEFVFDLGQHVTLLRLASGHIISISPSLTMINDYLREPSSRMCVPKVAIAQPLIYAISMLNVPWQQQQYATARLAVAANSCAVASKRLPP
jgi:hypothetical protein